jgi:protein-S-isoprenylcysteine O-methyltransferase Ste14
MIDAQFVNQLALYLWMPVFLLWAIAGAGSKQTIHSRSEGRSRIAVWFVWAAWFLLFSHGFRRPPLSSRFVPMTPVTVYIGLALTIVGLLFSVWARVYIGRNWSPQIEMKEDHQLIHDGPYAVVRHPIYSGFMLATLGTAIAFGEWSGLLSFVLIVTAWGYKARLEETAMIEQFGAEYERYRRKVKGLIPFVW